jgi:hypothetical protein
LLVPSSNKVVYVRVMSPIVRQSAFGALSNIFFNTSE